MADSLYDTGNAVGSTDAKDLHDNAIVFDQLINSTDDSVTNRIGNSLPTYPSLVAKMESSGGTLAFSSSTALLASTPSTANTLAMDTSTGTYYLWSGSAWSLAAYRPYERINTIRALSEGNRWGGAAQAVTVNDHYLLTGIYYNASGVRTVDSTGTWRTILIPVEIGDKVKAYFQTSDTSTGSTFAYVAQLDESSVFSSNLATLTTTGAMITIDGTYTATINGFIAIRCRMDGIGYYSADLIRLRAEFSDAMRSSICQQVYGEVMNAGGTVSTGNAGVIAVYIPVEIGDEVNFSGRVGHTAGTDYMVIAQCDTSKAYSLALATESSSTSYKYKQYSVKAVARGYIYVRTNLGLTRSLTFGRKTNVRNNILEKDLERNMISSEKDHYYEPGLIISATGVRTEATTSTTDWRAYWVPVKKGDTVVYRGYMGDSSTGSAFGVINQHDRNGNFIANLASYTTTGARVASQVSGRATADGLVYVRVYALSAIITKQPFSIKVIPRKALGLHANTPRAIASLDTLPELVDGTQGYNMAPFCQDNIQHFNGYMYCVAIAKGGVPYIFKKAATGGVWESFNLGSISGNPLNSPTTADGHNSYSLGITENGYLIISGNMHANACRCVISNNIEDITAWTASSYTTSTQVTYPRFLKYPDGTIQALWREGISGNGVYYSSIFDEDNKTWATKIEWIAESTTVTSSPYEQRIGISDSGEIHLCWGYRLANGKADSNFGMYYAKSADKGVTWTSASGGTTYTLPLLDTNSEQIATIATGTGYVNQCGGTCDLKGYYHTVIWQLVDNKTQYMHIWFNGTTWLNEIVSDFDLRIDTSGDTVTESLSRPMMCCTPYGKIYIVYLTDQEDFKGQYRAIDVTTAGLPEDILLAPYNAGPSAPAFDDVYARKWGVIKTLMTRGGSTGISGGPGHIVNVNLP